MSRRVLVTGYGGFLGSEVTKQLISAGDTVIGLGRGDYAHLKHLEIERVRGDIRDLETLYKATKSVDAVIHTAALAGVWGPWKRYYSINTIGTENVLKACVVNGVRVLIYCSSPSVTFDGSDQSGIDETVSYPRRWLCHYPHTKALAEQLVLSANQPGTLWTCALRPHLIWGANDPHLFPRLIERARRGRLRVVGSGNNTIDTVHVVNAAFAHLCALNRLWAESRGEAVADASGRAYFITQGEPVACWEWIGQVLEIAGVQRPRNRLSFGAAWKLGHALEVVYQVLRRDYEPPMTRFVAAQLARDHYFDISAARSLLGYRPLVSNAVGLDELRHAWSDR